MAAPAQRSDLRSVIKFLPKLNERDPNVFFSLFENELQIRIGAMRTKLCFYRLYQLATYKRPLWLCLLKIEVCKGKRGSSEVLGTCS